MMSMIGDILSIGFVIVLILLSSTFGVALITPNHRRPLKLITAVLTVLAIGFMVMFIVGVWFFPEPV